MIFDDLQIGNMVIVKDKIPTSIDEEIAGNTNCNSLNGHLFKVKAIQLPFLVVESMNADNANIRRVGTLDVRDFHLMKASREYVRAFKYTNKDKNLKWWGES